MLRFSSCVMAALIATAPISAHAQVTSVDRFSGQVIAGSAYQFMELFNERFSNKPFVEVSGTFTLESGAYVSAYVSTGFEQPFADEASNYGAEIGKVWSLGDMDVTVAAGRYANYYGQGFNSGDWYARVDVRQDGLIASVGTYHGVTDSVILAVAYDISVSDRLTVTPRLAYATASKSVNPALEVRYRIDDSHAVTLEFVGIDRDGRRAPYAALTITKNF